MAGLALPAALRRSGALKLLKRAEADHIHEPIDWFMIDRFGNDKNSLIAYKSVPHVFVNPKSSADRSTTEQVYGLAESDLMMANMLRLQKLDTIHGWGNARLVNARVSKPSELSIMAMAPAFAQLRTRKQGDRVLALSFHLAHLGQVS